MSDEDSAEQLHPRWIIVDEIGNDNFATSIYENEHKGLLVARCNQNGQYPWQARAIICGLEQNKPMGRMIRDPSDGSG